MTEYEEVEEYSEEDMKKWRKAAKIAAEVLEYSKSLIKNGSSYLEVSDKVDAKIYASGAKPAWATQISFDSVAAHQCAAPDDERVFDNNVVKVDVGVRVDGFIGDNALTVDLSGNYADLVKASRDALNTVEKALGVGVPVTKLGKIISETIESYGYKPVRNLSGHTIEHRVIHAAPTIPNVSNGDMTELENGQVIAIEPFATDGAGLIFEQETDNTLFAMVQKKPVRSPFAKEVLAFIEEEYEEFPFTTRWLVKNFGKGKTALALRELGRLGILREHPPLVERGKGMVSQAENTFLIGDKVERLTKF